MSHRISDGGGGATRSCSGVSTAVSTTLYLKKNKSWFNKAHAQKVQDSNCEAKLQEEVERQRRLEEVNKLGPKTLLLGLKAPFLERVSTNFI